MITTTCDRLMNAVEAFTTLFEESKGSKLAVFGQLFPIIYRLPLLGYMSRGRFEEILELPRQTIREDIERALKSYSVDQEPECLVQAYYQKMQTNPHLNHENLLNVCMDFFLAGMETTTTTLRWSSLLLAAHPEVQEKMRDEILSVIGRDGKPTSSARAILPYTNAAIQEIQRCANIIPVNVTHRTVRDTSVGSTRIPADTLVIGDIHHILAHSPVFEASHEFRPERFLLEDGVTPNKKTVEQLCPFSVGKRQCAGEALARVELFIGVVTLLQNYRIEPAKGRTIDLEPKFDSVLFPKEQPLRLIPVEH
ncbi:unspecific monooxygenase [Cooperia oncophora]